MAKQCPVCGEPKLYLDCLECEDRHQCSGMAGKKQEQNNQKE